MLDTSVSGSDILAMARAAGADMNDADITCSGGTWSEKNQYNLSR